MFSDGIKIDSIKPVKFFAEMRTFTNGVVMCM